MAVYDGFEPVIGLEVHAQLQTSSKIFCGCQSSYGELPNGLTCPVCLGLPGSLPVLNRQAVELAMLIILAVDGQVNHRSIFARKNYFYPDLPKGYQISQFDLPVGTGGAVRYTLDNGEEKSCRLERIHLEEDAGKLLHPEHGESYSRVDYNRCGSPLAEIVSKADLRSPQEANGYLTKLKQLLQYTGVCSGDMEKGHLRCDANVSVRRAGVEAFGTRTELKNMNSFKGVERALEYEIRRQVSLLKTGGSVEQATLLWNEDKQVAEMMRSKEDSHDYRYFPEPDLGDLVISDAWIKEIRSRLPELPDGKMARFIRDYGIREYDAAVLTSSLDLANYYDKLMASFDDGQAAANWVITELLGFLKDAKEDVTGCLVQPEQISGLLASVKSGEISGKIAKQVFREMTQTGKDPAEIIRGQGLAQQSDERQLQPLVDEVLRGNPEEVAEYKGGKQKLFGFFMGQIMKATRGQANPEVVTRLLKERLEG